MGLLNGKVAVITGAARGIGKAIALKYASEGADIAFTDLNINEAAEATVKELEAYGVKVKAYASNAADFEETHKVVAEIVSEFGHIDILVNNAGITKDGLMMRMTEAQWDAVINVNLKSAFNFIHAVTPVMAKQRHGSIINMSSVVGVSGNAGQCNYSASKAGLIGLAKSIAKEMGPRGIRANCIAPGFIITDMTNALPEKVREADSAPQRRHSGRRSQRGSLPRFGTVFIRQRTGHPLLRRNELLEISFSVTYFSFSECSRRSSPVYSEEKWTERNIICHAWLIWRFQEAARSVADSSVQGKIICAYTVRLIFPLRISGHQAITLWLTGSTE